MKSQIAQWAEACWNCTDQPWPVFPSDLQICDFDVGVIKLSALTAAAPNTAWTSEAHTQLRPHMEPGGDLLFLSLLLSEHKWEAGYDFFLRHLNTPRRAFGVALMLNCTDTPNRDDDRNFCQHMARQLLEHATLSEQSDDTRMKLLFKTLWKMREVETLTQWDNGIVLLRKAQHMLAQHQHPDKNEIAICQWIECALMRMKLGQSCTHLAPRCASNPAILF